MEMSSAPAHLAWLVDTGKTLNTACGRPVSIWALNHQTDEQVLSDWAKHFRNHYCPDNLIDLLRGAKTRKEYLEQIKFPSKHTNLGPSVRSGDFAEILVADY